MKTRYEGSFSWRYSQGGGSYINEIRVVIEPSDGKHDEVKELAIGNVVLEMDDSEDAFEPLRYTTGVMSIYGGGELSAADFFANTEDGMAVSIEKDGVKLFEGFVSQEDFEESEGSYETFDLNIVDRLRVYGRRKYWEKLPVHAGSSSAVDSGGASRLIDLLCHCCRRIGGIESLRFPACYTKSIDVDATAHAIMEETLIPNYLTMEYNGEGEDGESSTTYWSSRRVEDVLREVGLLFGVTWTLRGSTLYGTTPLCEDCWIYRTDDAAYDSDGKYYKTDIGGKTALSPLTLTKIHGAKSVKVVQEREKYDDLVGGTTTDGWKFSSRMKNGELTDGVKVTQDIMAVSGNNYVWSKDFQTNTRLWGSNGNTSTGDNGLAWYSEGAAYCRWKGKDGSATDIAGFLCSLRNDHANSWMTKENALITLRSRSCMMNKWHWTKLTQYGELVITLRASALCAKSSGTTKRESCSLRDSGRKTCVYATVRIGTRTVCTTKKMTFLETEDGTLKTDKGELRLPLYFAPKTMIVGTLEVSLSVGTDDGTQPDVHFVILQDVAARYEDDVTAYDDYIDPYADPSAYRYSQGGNLIGEGYELSCCWNTGGGKCMTDKNTVYGLDSIYADGEDGAKNLGKAVKERLVKVMLRNRLRMKIETMSDYAIAPYHGGKVIYGGEEYMVDATRIDFSKQTQTYILEKI